MRVDLLENILNRLGIIGAYSSYIAFAWLHIELDIGKSCPILSTIVLFFQQQIHLMKPIERGSILLLIIF